MFSPRRCSSRPGSVARQSPDFRGLRQASDPAMGDPSNPGKNSMGNSMGTWSAAENSMGFHECLSFVHSEVSEILKTHWWECLKLILKLISQVNSLIYTPFFCAQWQESLLVVSNVEFPTTRCSSSFRVRFVWMAWCTRPGKHTKSYWSHGHRKIVRKFPWIAWWCSIVMLVSLPRLPEGTVAIKSCHCWLVHSLRPLLVFVTLRAFCCHPKYR